MNEQDNRLIAEWLGMRYYTGNNADDIFDPNATNADFSHRDGFWLIMEKGPSNEVNWWSFMQFIGSMIGRIVVSRSEDRIVKVETTFCIPTTFIGPRLAEELLKFIKEDR